MKKWKPCMKQPVVVYFREIETGETHVTTKNGPVPLNSDDYVLCGVDGEEYPINKKIFESTYKVMPEGVSYAVEVAPDSEPRMGLGDVLL